MHEPYILYKRTYYLMNTCLLGFLVPLNRSPNHPFAFSNGKAECAHRGPTWRTQSAKWRSWWTLAVLNRSPIHKKIVFELCTYIILLLNYRNIPKICNKNGLLVVQLVIHPYVLVRFATKATGLLTAGQSG